MELRNMLLQRDSTLATRWFGFKLRLPMLLALVELYFDGGNASQIFFTMGTRRRW